MGDIKEAIKKVLTKSKSKKQLKEIGMKEGNPLASYKLVYDAPTAQLEPIYFWLLDFMQEGGMKVEKIIDNFSTSPGSGHFAEMGARATRMQEEGMKILGAINQVIKSILNLIYDLKEFEIRLGHYQDAKSKDKDKKEAATLALKQIWLDNVDMKRGRGSIHQMTYELGFTTLRDAFMVVNSKEEADKMAGKDGIINDQVKRILIPRISEFLKWQEISEKELTKRFEIEKSYLRSQVGTLKLYSSWAKPYMKAAEELRMKGFDKNPALVNAFNTAMFQLTLFGESKVNLEKAAIAKEVPYSFKDKKLKRNYYSCIVLDIVFRGIPQKVTQQNYGFGGRVEMNFDCYPLNEDEINCVKKELEEDDIETSFRFLQAETDQSLEQLKEDIEHFSVSDKKKKEKDKKSEDANPFSSLWNLFKGEEKKGDKNKIEKIDDIKKDSFVEKAIRQIAAKGAKGRAYALYDIYKKAHGHASTPEPFDN